MSFQWLDLILIGIMLISGILAMMRGFTREALSLVAWGGAALAAYFAIKQQSLIDLVLPHVDKLVLAQIIVGAVAFIITLIILSLVSVKISDLIVDSAVGGFDRTIGLFFGLFRGYLLVVIAYLFYGWLLPPERQDPWVRDAVTLPAIKYGGGVLLDFVPANIAETLSNTALSSEPSAKQNIGGSASDEQKPETGYQPNATQGLDNIIQGTGGSSSAPQRTSPQQPAFGQGSGQ